LAENGGAVTRRLIHPWDGPTPDSCASEARKNELLLAQHEMIERMAAQITKLESLVGKRRKPKSGKRPPREGKHRPLTETPDKTERVMASECGHCGTDVTGQVQQCRQRYDHVDLPPIRSIVTRVELWSGRCRCYGRRYKAQAPVGMASGSPFGPGIRAIMAYLHHSCGFRGHRAHCSDLIARGIPR
jgi:transposase